jgi:hypothetical protein
MARPDMVRWLPKRFSIRGLLILVALVAFALVAWRERTHWNKAHYDYKRALSAWQIGYTRTSDVVGEVEALYDAESRTIWMPESTARMRHVERLSELADDMEARAMLSMSWEAIQDYKKFAEQLRTRAAELSQR